MENRYSIKNLIEQGYVLQKDKSWSKPTKGKKVAKSGTSERVGTSKSKTKKPEQALQKAVCLWIRQEYPEIYFFSDPSGMYISNWGLKMTLKQNRSKHAALDIVVLQPSQHYKGLVIELKADTPYTKDGQFKKSDHLEDQIKTVNHLSRLGYFTCFAWDLNQVKHIVINYLK